MTDNVKFISDLHFGHKNIHEFRSELGLSNELEHREFIVDRWNSVVNKRDVVWVLGDICFTKEALPWLAKLKGRKFAILGNHDIRAELLLPHFEKVGGLVRYKEFWLSHAPIHPVELRGKVNIHGHVHNKPLEDKLNYVNVSCEGVDYKPITLTKIRSWVYEGVPYSTNSFLSRGTLP